MVNDVALQDEKTNGSMYAYAMRESIDAVCSGLITSEGLCGT